MKYRRGPRKKMQPISLKLSEDLEALLERLSQERNMPRSVIIREALRAYAAGERPSSATSVAGDLVGSLNGPRDLSTAARHMDGFGE